MHWEKENRNTSVLSGHRRQTFEYVTVSVLLTGVDSARSFAGKWCGCVARIGMVNAELRSSGSGSESKAGGRSYTRKMSRSIG